MKTLSDEAFAKRGQRPQLPLKAIAFPDSRFPIPDSRFPIPDSRFPIPDFLTIPILTESLIVETTAVDLTPTLSTLTTL
ncbi:MAG: hypothetical protein F6K65_32695 [Moorea sp. SIO3C2]|nr:hypothetical protein [Moorena sp. SIO3C2]